MKRLTRRMTHWLAAAGGAWLAILTVIGVVISWRSQPLPPLTADRLDSAWARWQANDLANYNIQVEVSGPQAATYRVEIRDRQVVLASRNGYPLKTQRTLGTWSVPGMFDTVEVDLDRRDAGAASSATQTSPTLRLCCVFDQQYGFPSQYRRNELGTQMQVDWKVTEFNALP